MSLTDKVANLRRQLDNKTVVIWFEPGEESINLVLAEDIPKDGDY